MAGKETDPFGFSEGTRVALEQTHEAMDIYFDFLMKSISAFPSFGTEIGDSFEETLRIQMAFMHSQLNRDAAKKPKRESSD